MVDTMDLSNKRLIEPSIAVSWSKLAKKVAYYANDLLKWLSQMAVLR